MKYRKLVAFVMTACILMGATSHVSIAETEADPVQADVTLTEEKASVEPEEKKPEEKKPEEKKAEEKKPEEKPSEVKDAEEKPAETKREEEKTSEDVQEKPEEKKEAEEKEEPENNQPEENRDTPPKGEDVNISEPSPEEAPVEKENTSSAEEAPVEKENTSSAEEAPAEEENASSGEESKETVSDVVSDMTEGKEETESDESIADDESVEETEQEETDSEGAENSGDNKDESEKSDASEAPETEKSEDDGESGEDSSGLQPETSTDEAHNNKEPENVSDGSSAKKENAETEEDNTGALSVKLSADRKYAFVGSDTAKFTASVSGGKAPYTVEFQAKGASDKNKTFALEQPEKCVFKCKPDSFGKLSVTAKVTDAEGNTAVSKTEIEAPVLIREKVEKWETELEEAELNGNWNHDLISIAVTQLGYEESSRNFIIADDGKKMGYTRYGDLFGRDYNEWCGLFVCFCMHYAGIPEADYPRDSISHNWKKAVEKAGAFEVPEKYTPRSGDIIFFNTDDDSRIDHMGIVEFADDDEIHTIEGNSGKKVVRKCYDSDDDSIAGYASTEKMMEMAGLDADEGKKKDTHRPAEYKGYTKGTMVNIRQIPDANGGWLACIPEKDTRVTVLAAEFSKAQLWYRVRYEGIEGYILSTLLKVDGYTELINAGEN